jgi:hypothetical protein
MINKNIKKLEEIINQKGGCFGIKYPNECPLHKICFSYNIKDSNNWYN